MNTIANRLIVIAAGALAFGTMAFGQTRMTAEIPFAFRTAGGTLPAGNYEVSQMPGQAGVHMVLLRNTASGKTTAAAVFRTDPYGAVKAGMPPAIDFACTDGDCRLTAIRTRDQAMVCGTPGKSRKDEGKTLSAVSIPARVSRGD